MNLYTGVTALAPTMFDGDGELDLFACAKLFDRIAEAGCGVAVCGRIGERTALGEEERTALVCESAEVCRGRAPLIVCLDVEEGARALAFASEAAALGADGFLVGRWRRNGSGLYEFCARLARLGLPVCVERGEGKESLPQFAELAALRELRAIAETGDRPFEALELTQMLNDRGRATAGAPILVCGNEKNAAFCGVTGEQGLLSAAAALFPAQISAFWRKNAAARAEDCLHLAPLFELFSSPDAPALLKWALCTVFGACPTVRLPAVPPDASARLRVERAVRAVCGAQLYSR